MNNLKEIIILFENADALIKEHKKMQEHLKKHRTMVQESLALIDKFFPKDESFENRHAMTFADELSRHGIEYMQRFDTSKELVFNLRDKMGGADE